MSEEKQDAIESKIVLKIDSIALQRIINEVKHDGVIPETAYNRVYHRHNR